MIVEQLSLVDFRNYAAAEVTLDRGPNLFVGSNGQGKTNLAEAIAYLATLGSHRVSTDAPLVREGADAAIIRTRLAHGERRVQLELQINRQGSNKARVNGAPIRPAELPRYAQVVLFAPEDLQIVRGDPSARRRFVDQLLIQRAPRMSGVLADYDRVLPAAQCPAQVSPGARDPRRSAVHARGVGRETRRPGVRGHRHPCRAQRRDVGAARPCLRGDRRRRSRPGARVDAVGARRRPGRGRGCRDRRGRRRHPELFRAALAARRSAELDRGVTLVGPHRDDLLLRVRGLPVKGYASHGESWSMALGLRLASAELLRERSLLGDPVLILDDVFAELDADRRERLAGMAAGYEQVIVTAAVEPDVPDALRAHVVRVEAGTILPADAIPAAEPADGR
ncbi:DNA replication/repair protein RecF [Microbacterium elymi]|uniref:DNA replication and repair protein RecF n=1 Tax=Microbacterium elymi TaxID=2909587 RepID=A0ABY5NGN0_9MICO|nr:DNA replication/repair protein RecF [Microbacterium elymi]UUT34339.1 DNA replication/repair protein RecF [Microbacterium elymi]